MMRLRSTPVSDLKLAVSAANSPDTENQPEKNVAKLDIPQILCYLSRQKS